MCPIVEGKNLCLQSLQLQVDPFYQPLRLPLRFDDLQAGQAKILATICSKDTCVKQDVALVQSPASLDHVKLHTPTSSIVQGGLLPFTVHGYDVYENPVFWTDKQFALQIQGGSLDPLQSVTGISLA